MGTPISGAALLPPPPSMRIGRGTTSPPINPSPPPAASASSPSSSPFYFLPTSSVSYSHFPKASEQNIRLQIHFLRGVVRSAF